MSDTSAGVGAGTGDGDGVGAGAGVPGFEDLIFFPGSLKRCGGGMSSPALGGSNDDATVARVVGMVGNLAGAVAGLPRTHSMSALRSRPTRRAVFWEQQCFASPTKRD